MVHDPIASSCPYSLANVVTSGRTIQTYGSSFGTSHHPQLKLTCLGELHPNKNANECFHVANRAMDSLLGLIPLGAAFGMDPYVQYNAMNRSNNTV